MEKVEESSINKFFMNIRTPQGLLDFMGQKIKYGFMGKNNKLYSKARDLDKVFPSEYYLQRPEELLKSGYGVCWDAVELERFWFKEHNFQFKTYFMIFSKEYKNNLPTHTFLAYQEERKWFWFEHSFFEHRGIWQHDSLDDLISNVISKHLDASIKEGRARKEDEKDLIVCEFDRPNYGCDPQEYIDYVLSRRL